MDQKTSPIPIKHTPISAPKPKIIVVGLGGGGCNAVNRMIEFGMKGCRIHCLQYRSTGTRKLLSGQNHPVRPKVHPWFRGWRPSHHW
jgi:cell division GTPase FtsZ